MKTFLPLTSPSPSPVTRCIGKSNGSPGEGRPVPGSTRRQNPETEESGKQPSLQRLEAGIVEAVQVSPNVS
jgi:hypothetical protein